jgi:hypothetical protein
MWMPNGGGSDGKNERLDEGPRSGQMVRHQRERENEGHPEKNGQNEILVVCRQSIELRKVFSMLPEDTPLPSINDPEELRQRTAFCRFFLVTEEYTEWYCDGRTLHVMDFTGQQLEYDLIEDLQYYQTFPACIEDWAEAISRRIVDGSSFDSGAEEGKAVAASIASALLARPESIRALIGTAVIEEDYFELLDDEDSSGRLNGYTTE